MAACHPLVLAPWRQSTWTLTSLCVCLSGQPQRGLGRELLGRTYGSVARATLPMT